MYVYVWGDERRSEERVEINKLGVEKINERGFSFLELMEHNFWEGVQTEVMS